MAPRGPQRAQDGLKIAEDSPTWLKIANSMRPRGPKRATRRSQVLLETSQDLPEKSKSFKKLKKINDFGLLALSPPIRF
eukprot:4314110-Pyramimonas_sp.AAC.1